MSVPPTGPVEIVLPALDSTFGALLIGSTLGAALWGVGTLQLYFYYLNYPKDHPAMKSLVALVWMLDTTQQALIGHVVYFYLVKNYFNPLILDFYVWSLNVQSLFEALTSLVVQSFFVYRIGRLSQWNYFFTGIAGVLVLAKFGVGVAYVAQGIPLHSIKLAFSKLHSTSEAINGLSAATDVTIAAILIWLLYRSKTAFSKTNTLIHSLILYTVNTSALTSLCSVISLATAQSMPTNFVYGAFYFLVARLYVNSMLATLNARQTLSGNNITDVDMSRLRSGGPSNNSQTLNLSSSKFSSASEMRFKAAKNPEVTIGQPSFDETHGQEESYGKVDTRWQEATGISRV